MSFDALTRQASLPSLPTQSKRQSLVKVIALLTSTTVEKDYGPYTMEYSGGYKGKIRKRMNISGNYLTPTTSDIERFKEDVRNAAKCDVDVANFLINHSEFNETTAAIPDGSPKEKQPLNRRKNIRPPNYWRSLSDDDLIDMAKDLMKRYGITTMKDLRNADAGLFNAMQAKGIIKKVFPKP